MVRITINWEIISPFLKTISGILIIEEFPNSLISKKVLTCRITKEVSSTSYKSVNGKGYPYKIFKKYEDQINIIINSYFDGLTLSKSVYNWFDE